VKVTLDQTPQPSDAANVRSNTVANATASQVSSRPTTTTAPEPDQAASSNTATQSTLSGTPQTNVTFRRDTEGHIYYVLTDAESGKELRQVPSEEIRKVSQGIEEYLKAQESKASAHVEAQA
jgi:uncharacterized FlaG/YvyC family protein